MIQVTLEGFNPVVFVTPARETTRPAPLTVVVHGNFDRPEWECELWRGAAASLGWMLCPRGYPRTDVDPRLDRWTYQGRTKLAEELRTGVAKLRELYPDQVTLDGAILVGFSLGANMAPRLVAMKVLPFRAMVLGEGGFQVTDSIASAAARSGIERVVYLCGERTICRGRAKSLERVWRRARVQTSTVVMPGVGHGYPDDFGELSRQVFELLHQEVL